MERLISPPLAELPHLRQPLTPGESMVLDMFCRTLDPGWEIYIQPHLNGLRPDFVLLHPQVGIAVFEVKDWNLDAVDYFIRKGTKRPELWARRDGKEFSRQTENPFPKVEYYREAI